MQQICFTCDFLTVRRVAVPDARFDHLCQSFKPASKVPPFLHVVDIAGLVRGAHEGQVSRPHPPVNVLIYFYFLGIRKFIPFTY